MKDGIMVSMGNTVEKQEPVPRMDPSLLLQSQGPGGAVIYGDDLQPGAQDARRSRRSRGSASGDVVVVVGPDGKKRRKKKKPAGEGEVEKIVVIDPVTGKKKVKRSTTSTITTTLAGIKCSDTLDFFSAIAATDQ